MSENMSEKENIFDLDVMKKISEKKKVTNLLKNKGFEI